MRLCFYNVRHCTNIQDTKIPSKELPGNNEGFVEESEKFPNDVYWKWTTLDRGGILRTDVVVMGRSRWKQSLLLAKYGMTRMRPRSDKVLKLERFVNDNTCWRSVIVKEESTSFKLKGLRSNQRTAKKTQHSKQVRHPATKYSLEEAWTIKESKHSGDQKHIHRKTTAMSNKTP